MKKKMKAVVVTSMLAIGLFAGNALAQPGNTAQQEQMDDMMNGGMMNGGMMGMHDNMMGGQGRWNMGCNGMMGGAMMSLMSPGQQQEYMNQTTELRKHMMEKRFEYMEAMRNPNTTPQDLAKIEKDMLELRTKMMDKMNTLQGR